MIITFCGHSNFFYENQYKRVVLNFLESKIGYTTLDVFLGGYGFFDDFAYSCSREYKEKHKDVSLCYISPYLVTEVKKTELEQKYDQIIYPPIEKIPARYAILHRNRYMVEQSDIVIAYITHRWGGAYKTYEYAKQKKKNIFLINSPDIII